MVGVGPLQPLACATFPGALPWAGELTGTLGGAVNFCFIEELDTVAVKQNAVNHAWLAHMWSILF